MTGPTRERLGCTAGDIFRVTVAGGLILAAIFFPPFSYMANPGYLDLAQRESVSRLELDHEGFGVI